MQEWLVGLPFALVVAVITFLLTIIANIIIDHRRRNIEKKNVLSELLSTFEFILKFSKKHIRSVEEELEPLLKRTMMKMVKIQKIDLTVCESILPKLYILDKDLIYDFVKIYQNLKSSNEDIDQMNWFYELFKNPEMRELYKRDLLFERIRMIALRFISSFKKIDKKPGIWPQMEKLIEMIEERL